MPERSAFDSMTPRTADDSREALAESAHSETPPSNQGSARLDSKRMTPSVTIAIPTFNRVELLRRAVESARNQDYPNVKVLICDNASSDDTAAYCRGLADVDERVSVVRHPENVGPARNFLAGVAIAETEYFMWLGDDDWIERGFVSACVRALGVERGAVLAAPAEIGRAHV